MAEKSTVIKAVIALLAVLFIGGIVALIIIVRSPEEEEVIVEEFVPCTADSVESNQWCCDGITHPLIIDTIKEKISVKLGEKYFDEREITELKKVHSFHERSTYDIFEEITERTKRCEYTIDSYVISDPYYRESQYTG